MEKRLDWLHVHLLAESDLFWAFIQELYCNSLRWNILWNHLTQYLEFFHIPKSACPFPTMKDNASGTTASDSKIQPKNIYIFGVKTLYSRNLNT